MHSDLRNRFNRAFGAPLFQRVVDTLESQVGTFKFRLAETPLLLTPALRDELAQSSREIVAQLSEPALLENLKLAIPPELDVPGMDPLPNCVQVDFALTRDADGRVTGRVVELQAFPSLYALMALMSDAWARAMNDVPELRAEWSCFVGMDREAAIDLMRRTIVAGEDPREVVLVDLEPSKQKTAADFHATQLLLGVDSVCITDVKVDGNRLYREVDGERIPIKRLYNRLVWDELQSRGVKPAFDWKQPLDVTWCSHPNWYWVWSKYSLPFLDHPAVPRAHFLSDLKEIPADLSRWVLKPLFSFAGAGVVVDVTPEHLERVPAEQRHGWVLQEKIDYAPVIEAPDGTGVRAEVRVMLLRPPGEEALTPLLNLVRLSRGAMMGVDQNTEQTWVGGSVGMWAR